MTNDIATNITARINVIEPVPNIDINYGPYDSIAIAQQTLNQYGVWDENAIGLTVGIWNDNSHKEVKDYTLIKNDNGNLELTLKVVSSGDNIENVTYAELKTFVTQNSLTPGKLYRITDYVCTTIQENTQSANHAFDIIVRADDENHLNENAHAAHHAGDEYFANCKVEAWELKYSISNDTNRFAWADDTNGKGVVYWMKDEWNNECPYDFKNIMFKRWAVTEVTDQKMTQDTLEALNEVFVFDGDNTKFQTRFGYKGSDCSYGSTVHVVDSDDTGWYYTFSIIMVDVESGEFNLESIEDGSIKGNNFYNSDGGGGFYGNIMKPRYNYMASDDDGIDGAQVLNNIVFNGYYENSEEAPNIYACFMNYIGSNCHENTFGNCCYENSFGNSFNYNSFGNYCYGNSFGNYCYENSFGDGCYNNSFGNSCDYNSFGNECYENSFGNTCNSNSFGNKYFGNSFGNYCYRNSFGNYCYGNSFGNYCYENSFGNECCENSFVNNCTNNSFGNSCYNNSFGNECYGNSFGNYCRQITVFDGVIYCNVTGGSSEQSYVQNAQILNGTVGASNENKLTITFTANKHYVQIAGMTTSGNLEIWNPADLVALPNNLVYTGED